MAVLGLHEVFGEGLEGIGSEIGIVATTGQEEAAHQVVELLLVDLVLRALGDDAARSDVVEVVEVLGRVALHLVGIDGVEGLDRLLLESYIIVIGGVDDGILGLGIKQGATIVVGEIVDLFMDAADGLISQFAILMELAVARTTLTETHLLDVGDEALYLMVGGLDDLVEDALSLVVLHAHDVDEGEVVEGLCPTRTVAFSERCGTLGIGCCRVGIAVVIGVSCFIQLVDRQPIRAATG